MKEEQYSHEPHNVSMVYEDLDDMIFCDIEYSVSQR